MVYLVFSLGLVLLLIGGEYLVKGASDIARYYKLSPTVIGLTIVGMGTSTPELLVSLQSAAVGEPSIAIGNVIGSNITNILLTLGASAAIFPIALKFKNTWLDLVVMCIVALILWAVIMNGVISSFEGVFLLVGLLIFIYVSFKFSNQQSNKTAPEKTIKPPPKLLISSLKTAGGMASLLIGANLLVDSASEIARGWGVSEAIIGLTIVAIGTSLPELTANIFAAWRKESEIAFGSVVGSNAFNILGVLGTTAVVYPITVDDRFISTDIYGIFGATALLVMSIALFKGIPRWVGLLFLVLYSFYIFTVVS